MSPISPTPGTPRETTRPIGHAFGLLAAALLILSAFYTVYAWHAVQREQSAALRTLSSFTARSANLSLRDYEGFLPLLAMKVREAGGPERPEQVQAILDAFVSAKPGTVALQLLDAEGKVVASATAAGSQSRPAIEATEANLRQAGVRIGKAVRDPATSAWYLPLQMRYPASGADEAVHVLVALVDTGRQQSAWSGSALAGGAVAGLLTDSGVLLGAAAGADVAQSSARQTAREILTHHLAAQGYPKSGELLPTSHFEFYGYDLAFQRLAHFPVTAFVAVSRTAAWATWVSRVQVPLGLFALSLAGLVFAAAWTHRQHRTREAERDAAESLLEQQQTRLARQAALLDRTERAAHVGGWELDLASGVVFWTDEAYRIHRTEKGQFTPTLDAVSDLYTRESRELYRAAVEKSFRAVHSWDIEVELASGDGPGAWVRVTGASEPGPAGLPAKVFGSVQDVTDRHRADERIRRLAHYDDLTGLANRTLFTHHLTHALARAERYSKHLAVLFIDLDRFKIINDTLGHDTGDIVLKAIARRLSESMRAADLVARLGGDEFVVVAEELDNPEAVAEVAAKLLAVIDQPVMYQGQELALTASIGIAVSPEDGRDLQTLLKHADIAMYRAKEQGKNRHAFYSSCINTSNVDRLSLESRLKKAVLEQNQFVLHYQPKVSIQDGRITGAEALVRWMSPDRGLVPPNEFIPLAEETGLISAIGDWVFETACHQAAAWARKGLPPIRIAVNLSARQFYGQGFVDGVRQVLESSGVRPGAIELELTESVMMQNVQYVADLLMELKLLGLHIAVDDFGTGYSSLSYLKRLPLDALKVDRSFVRDVPRDPDDVAITTAVIALAHSLRLKVVAEGVETEAQLGFLRELQCDEIQGFLFSKPVPAAEFEDLLRRDVRLVSGQARSAA
jgi:diguanylate cyclase (GGDEF)-like protein